MRTLEIRVAFIGDDKWSDVVVAELREVVALAHGVDLLINSHKEIDFDKACRMLIELKDVLDLVVITGGTKKIITDPKGRQVESVVSTTHRLLESLDVFCALSNRVPVICLAKTQKEIEVIGGAGWHFAQKGADGNHAFNIARVILEVIEQKLIQPPN